MRYSEQGDQRKNALDHLLITRELQIYKPSIVAYEAPIGRADYLILIATPEHNIQFSRSTREHRVYDFRKSNKDRLQRQAELVNLEETVSESDDPNSQWRKLRPVIENLIDDSIPQKNSAASQKKLVINDE